MGELGSGRAIGEVVGAFGVIVTLGYLAVQIRQNSAVVRASTHQAISTVQAEIGYRLAENAELRTTALRFTNLESTVPEAELAAHFYLRAVLRTYENQYHQYVDGTFDLLRDLAVIDPDLIGPCFAEERPLRLGSRRDAHPCRR